MLYQGLTVHQIGTMYEMQALPPGSGKSMAKHLLSGTWQA